MKNLNRRMLSVLVIFLGWAAGAGELKAEGPVRRGALEVELVSGREEVKPGESFWLGIKFALDPEWHLYWVNPGGPGFPPEVRWKLGDGIAVDELQFPRPKSFESFGGISYGYENEFLLLARATLSAEAPVGSELKIGAKVSWLACDPETCVPGDVEVGLILRVGEGANSAAAQEMEEAVGQLPKASGWQVEAGLDDGAAILRLRMSGLEEALPLEGAEFFLEQTGIVDASKPAELRWEGESLVVEGALSRDFSGELPGVLSGLLLVPGGEEVRAWRVSTDPAAGGVVKVPGIEEEAAEGATGDGWGTWLQKPLVVMALAALMFLIGLNLMGVYEVGTGLTAAGGAVARKEGPMGSFLSGGLATIVATPCTAPFMGSAIFYALGQPPVVTLAIFTFLGVGMATPYLLLSRYPRLLKKLPRPGAWMETLKQGFAFPMFGVAIWLLWVLSFQVNQNGVLAAMLGLLLLGIAAWWFGRFATPVARKGVRAAAKVGTVALAGLALLFGVKASEQVVTREALDVEGRIRAIQESGKGVLVDFTAAWCLTCQTNKAALHSQRVEEDLEARGIEFLRVDWTQRDPEIHRVLQKYGREGVPLYLLFSKEVDAPPVELPNLLTEDILLRALAEGARGENAKERPTGFWAALFGAFVGGLILNLMPCVFPVISLKILSFVSQAGSDPKGIWRHGLAFAGGVLSFFWLLAILLLAARAGFGAG